MTTAKELTDTLIFRAKNLIEFEVETEVPEDFSFNGQVPFDLKIKDNMITAKVWAVDFNEAAQRLNEYLESNRDVD
jgi:hypothetical protein